MTVRESMRFVNKLNSDFKIVLASASPRRRQILELTGIEFEIWPSEKEELITQTDPSRVCLELSRQKAVDVAAQIMTYNDSHPELTTAVDILVIGADTIVAKDGLILGKPKDEDDAVRMLHLLSGNTHSVYTGVTFVFIDKDGRTGEYGFREETRVSFFPVDDEDIKAYVATGDVLDKAGAYGIQSGAAAFVRSIDGDFYNVMGLPIARLIHELKGIIG